MEALFFRVLTLSVTCGAVVGLALLLLPGLKKRYAAKTAYVLWLVLALRLVTPFEFALPDQTAVTLTPPRASIQLPVQQPPATMVMPGNTVLPMSPQTPAVGELPGLGELDLSGATVYLDYSRPAGNFTLAEVAAVLWLIGCAVTLLLQGGGYLLARRKLLKWAQPTSETEIALFNDLAGKKCPALYRAPVDTPMMLGMLRPVLLLPLEPLSGEELAIVLRHELTHWKRRDVAYKTLMAAACVLHWFNPLVWLMAHRAGQTVEACCDDAVVAGESEAFRKAYGMALLHTAANGKAIPFTTCFGGGKREMKERLQNLFVQRKNGPVAVCLLLCTALLLGGLISCSGEKPPEPVDTRVEYYGMMCAVGEAEITLLPITLVEEGDGEKRGELSLTDADFTDGVYLAYKAGAAPEHHPVDKETVTIQAQGLRWEYGIQEMDFAQFSSEIGMRIMASSYWRVHPVTGERLPSFSSVFRFVEEDGVIVEIEETGYDLSVYGLEEAYPEEEGQPPAYVMLPESTVSRVRDPNGPQLETYLSDEDVAALLALLEQGAWQEGTADCLNDVRLTLKGRTLYYHSDCGTFNETFFSNASTLSHVEPEEPEGSSMTLSEEDKEWVNALLERYHIYLGEEPLPSAEPSPSEEPTPTVEPLPWVEPPNPVVELPAPKPSDPTVEPDGVPMVYTDEARGFSLTLPASWNGRVVGEPSTDSENMTSFWYVYGDQKLRVMDLRFYEEQLQVGYMTHMERLGSRPGLWVYAYKIVDSHPEAVEQLPKEEQERLAVVLSDRSDVHKEDLTFFWTPGEVTEAFFAAFANANYEEMKRYCTHSCIDTYFHDGDVNGMVRAKLSNMEQGKPEGAFCHLFVTVEMETAPTSALYPETSTGFYVELIRAENGSWQINSFPTGL